MVNRTRLSLFDWSEQQPALFNPETLQKEHEEEREQQAEDAITQAERFCTVQAIFTAHHDALRTIVPDALGLHFPSPQIPYIKVTAPTATHNAIREEMLRWVGSTGERLLETDFVIEEVATLKIAEDETEAA